MEVLVSLNVPSGDGNSWDTVVLSHSVPDATSQVEALTMALGDVDAAGWDPGLVQGVRLDMGPARGMLPGETFLIGGLEAALALLDERRQSEALLAS